jgi:hypothetical protein
MINKLNQLASSPGSPHPPSTPSASSAQKEIADLIPQSNGQLADANSRAEDSAQPKVPFQKPPFSFLILPYHIFFSFPLMIPPFAFPILMGFQTFLFPQWIFSLRQSMPTSSKH